MDQTGSAHTLIYILNTQVINTGAPGASQPHTQCLVEEKGKKSSANTRFDQRAGVQNSPFHLHGSAKTLRLVWKPGARAGRAPDRDPPLSSSLTSTRVSSVQIIPLQKLDGALCGFPVGPWSSRGACVPCSASTHTLLIGFHSLLG